MFDLEIMIAIGSALLITAFVLIGVVIGLYYKVANTLKRVRWVRGANTPSHGILRLRA